MYYIIGSRRIMGKSTTRKAKNKKQLVSKCKNFFVWCIMDDQGQFYYESEMKKYMDNTNTQTAL